MKKIVITIDEQTDEIDFDVENCVNSDCTTSFGRVLGGIAAKAMKTSELSPHDTKRLHACLLWEVADNAGWDMVDLHKNIFPELIEAVLEKERAGKASANAEG